MQRSLEQRYSIKFCVKLNKTSTETIGLLKEAYGDQSLSSAQVKRWHKSFKEGREDVEDEQRSGRPSTTQTDEDVNRVREFLNIDRRASLREISEELNLTYYNVREIVTAKLEMRKVCAKLVPKVLSDEQKQLRVEKCREVLESDEQDNTLDNCITGDETWCFEYDPEGKRESAEWHTKQSPRPKKARMSKSKVKTMLIIFFDSRGIVHKEFVPPGSTVNAAFYKEVLLRLKNRVARVRPDLVNNWTLHHDNAPAHTAFLCTSALAKMGVPVLPHPPYSPDLSPPDFFLFPLVKRKLKGRRFDSIEAIQKAVTAELNAIPADEFKKCFLQWKDRYQRCIDAQGSYFEEY